MTRENERFAAIFPEVTGLTGVLPSVVAQTNTQTTTGASATATTVTGMTIVIPQHEFIPGATYKVLLYGTKSGTGGTLTVDIYLNATAALELVSGSSAAGDWRFEGYICSVGPAIQNSFGIFTQTGVASVVDFDSTTLSTVGDVTLKAVITNGSTDTSTVEHGRIEYVAL
jgi:hypothetical protein